MEKREVLFAIFGSVICLFAALGAYYIGRSNREFMRQEKERLNKKMSSGAES